MAKKGRDRSCFRYSPFAIRHSFGRTAPVGAFHLSHGVLGVTMTAGDMNPDDTICYCYHVSLRKLVNYARRTRPKRPSLMSECLGAGTGCGWCIPFVVEIAEDPDAVDLDDLIPEQYAQARKTYIRKGGPPNEFSG